MHTLTKIQDIRPGGEEIYPLPDELPKKLTIPVVYVIDLTGTDFVKIGSTSTPKNRFAGYQSYSPFPAVWAYHLCPPAGTCHTVLEQAAQRALGAQRVRGEWFKATAQEAIDAIRGAV